MTRFIRYLPWVLVAYIAAMFAMTLAGVALPSHYLDEYVHIDKLQNFLDYGLYSRIVTTDDAGNPVNVAGFVYVYGPIFSLVGHAIAVALGAETWGTVSVSDTAFVARHIAVALFSFVGVIAAGWTVAIVTRSRTWGLTASAILVSIPLWTGFAMFNVKDIPAATGFTLFTAGCVALTLPAERLGPRTRVGGWIALYAGSVIIWGVRPGLWATIVLAFLAMLLIHARLANFADWRGTIRKLVFPATAEIAAYLTMLAVYPVVFSNPVVLLYKSFADTSNFAVRHASLTDGERPPAPPPWYFLPKWAAAQLPEVLLVLAVIAGAVSVWLVLRRLVRSKPDTVDYALPAIVFIFIQFAAFPIAAVLLHANITSGLRQFLFVIPATAMLVTVVLYLAVTEWNIRRFRLVWPITAGLIALSTIVTSVIQLQMFPYQTNYFNPTTVARGIQGRWEVDRWSVAEGDLYSRLTQIERDRCRNCDLEDYPNPYLALHDDGSAAPAFDEAISLTSGSTNRNSCTLVAAVTTPYLWSSVDIARAMACPIAARPLELEGRGLRGWRTVTQWGWETMGSKGLTSRAGYPAAIAWADEPTTGDSQRAYVVSLEVGDGSASTVTVTAVVNGATTVSTSIPVGTPTEFELLFPASIVSRSSTASIVVEFTLTDESGKPVTNQLHVTDVRSTGHDPAAIQ